MQPYQERVVMELKELEDKRTKLGEFLKDVTVVDPVERQRLKYQHEIMGLYANILRDRIANFLEN